MIDHTEISAGLNTLESLRKLLDPIAELNISRFDKNDIRYYFINQLNRAIFCNTLNLSYFERTIKDKNNLDQILWTPTSRDHFEVMDSYINNIRLSMIINLSTITERFIRVIMQAIENRENYLDNIYTLRQKLMVRLGFSKESPLWIAQQILFNVRNTIHNNGIFTDKKYENDYNYAGKLHVFKFGCVHNSADFRTLSFIIRDLIAFYSLVLENDKIKKVDYIPEVLKICF